LPAWATAARWTPKDWSADYAAAGGTNLATGREIRIRTAARLRSEAKPAQGISRDEARRIVDKIEF
jgi:hypothetical protein